ncbi:metallohydrolase [Aerococcus urinaehominis]|uniref:Metallohydrolase n=1 Tax=Aerococcus urinaehominis TaxID=128944 RepID=A0A0X8FLJ3_9LACT|nr:MBL fold metallo-hydrolase [Aerococcus urinaehominis]AMB99515.1 metallohydrolase [Aerococcus urinaehominis]SDM25725.1 Phosphoribosyl 1,2-cyclic phosphodiesterase [Aerococcus urinaehominis]
MEISPASFDMRVSMLGSGSTGNCTYIETPKRKVLVDAGFSGSKIKAMLAKIDRDINDIDSLFITHEHSDHIKGLGVLARKYDIDLYANQATWAAIGDKCGKIDNQQKHIMEMGDMLALDDLDIMSYGVSHDAAEPQFYAFQNNGKQFAILTDTGYVSQKLSDLLTNCDAYLVESNHDLDMLRMGRYPWRLKQRILSDEGHLSNEAVALALTDMVGDKTKRVYLGHLSKENNMKVLANQTCEQILYQNDTGVNQSFFLEDTDPEEPTALYQL